MKKERGENGLEKATFAGGCFWCLEAFFEELEGVIDVVSGYVGGHTKNPTYEEVCSGTTGHLEAVQVTFDPSRISYERLLELFWTQIDPFDEGGQFVDRGSQYATAIFVHDETQRALANESKKRLELRLKKKIFTAILPFIKFYNAEDHNQNFNRICPVRYQAYKIGSGRERRLYELWNQK
jgi:peptide methionine sulfoxide reductase msrA/msrB